MRQIQIQLDFKLSRLWQEKLPEIQCNYLTELYNQSHDAMKTLIGMVESDWKNEIERFPICIETPPCAQQLLRKYMMASDAEFLHIKQSNPDLIVRTLTAEEMQHLTAQEDI